MFYNAALTHKIYGKTKPFDKISIFDLYNILCDCWNIDTCAPRLRDKYSKDNLTLGQCSITSFIVQDFYGGEVFGIPLKEGGYHCFNVVNNIVFDLTSEQFNDEKITYSLNFPQNREDHFKKKEKLDRYHLLSARLVSHIR